MCLENKVFKNIGFENERIRIIYLILIKTGSLIFNWFLFLVQIAVQTNLLYNQKQHCQQNAIKIWNLFH